MEYSLLSLINVKSMISTWNLRLLFIYYVLAFSLKLVVSSEIFLGLDQNPANPGIGVNYYGKIQKTTLKTLGNGLTFDHVLDDIVPRDCSKAPKGTRCIPRDKLFRDPDFAYTLLNPVRCDFSYPYRHYNGTCMNPHFPIVGITNDCYFRFTPPFYDGFGGFRKSATGNPLPEPRDISLKIFKDHHKPEVNLSFHFLMFGQLIAHDLSRIVQPQIDCCSPVNAQMEECAPIRMRPDDPFYSQFNQTCIVFQRSKMCTFTPTVNREQKNCATPALDASFLYGASENKVKQLRTLDGTGRLSCGDSSKFCLLPTGEDPDDIFCPKVKESKCFFSGDPRVNQHASLTSMMIIWTKEHNRIVEELKKMNPHWDEEKLFQEARKIVIAEFQCITYQDFLPLFLTPRIMEEFDMTIKKGSKYTLFSPLGVIAIRQEFAQAGFRLHTIVPSNIGSKNLPFKDTQSNPDLIRKGHALDLIKGFQHAPIEKYNRYMIKDLTEFMQMQPGVPYGKDLAAYNIQRGRDHGLAPYVEIVKFCSERTINITSFDDLVEFEIMTAKNVELLKQLYESVEDVDMWIGMQLEKNMNGSIVGPSTICICAKQFYFTQKDDRFFFNHGGLLEPFTADQRSAIKNSSNGRILCDNADVKEIPKNTFFLPTTDNPVVSCEEIPKVDLSLWKENETTANTS